MTARWILAGCLATPLFGQFGFYAVTSAGDQLINAPYALGIAAAGDSLSQRILLKNTSSTEASISLISVSGDGFVLKDVPRLPQKVAAGQFLEFTAWFQAQDTGNYSASLKADQLAVFLQATVAASASIFVEENNARRLLNSGATVDFGSVERGSSATRRFTLANSSKQGLSPAVTLGGAGFSFATAVAAPLLSAGDSISFTVICAPATAGALAGTLSIDGRQILLKAVGTEPPLPRPQILLSLTQAASGQQGSLSVPLATAARGSGNGKLSLDFRPVSTVAGDDPAVLFPLTGSRTIQFSVASGDTAARFGTLPSVEFQTGTTAGTLLFTLHLGGYTTQATVDVAAAPVHMDAIAAVRSAAGLEVRVSGFDNTRTAGKLTFTFYDRAGNAVAPGKIQVDATADFQKYFAASGMGGLFQLRAVFPVTGPTDQIEGADVQMTNSAATAASDRLHFQ